MLCVDSNLSSTLLPRILFAVSFMQLNVKMEKTSMGLIGSESRTTLMPLSREFQSSSRKNNKRASFHYAAILINDGDATAKCKDKERL